jgi:hypothetical protein
LTACASIPSGACRDTRRSSSEHAAGVSALCHNVH